MKFENNFCLLKKSILVACIFLVALTCKAQTTLLGTCTKGGIQFGTVFSFNPDSNYFNKVCNVNGKPGDDPVSNLIEASNGKLYGMTKRGGIFIQGVIYEYDPANNKYKCLFQFHDSLGSYPFGALVHASNGKLYGTTCNGGKKNFGVIFEFDISTNSYSKKFEFDSVTGFYPTGDLIEASTGKLYGLLHHGNNTTYGALFEFDFISNSYTIRHNFTNLTDGGMYSGGGIELASNGEIFGTTAMGGAYNNGVIFKYNLTNHQFQKVFDFNDSSFTGKMPFCALSEVSPGQLYGTSQSGGNYGWGVIFEYNYLTNTFNKKFDFMKSNGYWPVASLFKANNGKLYGTCLGGGKFNGGVIFEYDYLTNKYSKKISLNSPKGNHPVSSLMQASNGKLYGTAEFGGEGDNGVIYQYDYVSNQYKMKVGFNAYGGSMLQSLMQASNGKVYGLARTGGLHYGGTVFEYDYVNNSIIKKADFDTSLGYYPIGTMIEGNNNKLYGVTKGGGAYKNGVLFEFNMNTNQLIKKVDLIATLSEPAGSLFKAPNGKLYGLTKETYAFLGCIYEYDIITNTLTPKLSINDLVGSFTLSPTGKLLGMKEKGIFEYDYLNNTISAKAQLIYNITGDKPVENLVPYGNGIYYGLVSNYNYGIYHQGYVIEYNYVLDTVIRKAKVAQQGNNLKGGLIKASNNLLYGVTSSDGVAWAGTLYSYNPVNNQVAVKANFNLADMGSVPECTLLEINLTQTAINETAADLEQIKVYPNPSTGIFNFSFEDYCKQNFKVIVYDILGNVVLIEKFSSAEKISSLDLSKQPKGIYSLFIDDGEKFITKKLVLQ